MKRNFYTQLLLVILLMCTGGIHQGNAQTKAARAKILRETKVNSLRLKAVTQKEEALKAKAKALRLAKSKNLVIRKETKERGILELQRLRSNGAPLYYQTHNSSAAQSISTNRVWTDGGLGFQLNGEGMIVGEWDGGGVLVNHVEFNGRVEQRDKPGQLSEHATHVAGTMVATGKNSKAKGMASQAKLYAHDWNSDVSEMDDEAANGLLLSNHSYGAVVGWVYDDFGAGEGWYWLGWPEASKEEDISFGLYDADAANWDELANLAPYYLIVKSAGNDRGDGPDGATEHFEWDYVSGDWITTEEERPQDGGETGYDCIASKSLAKNVLTVGAVNDVYSYEGPESVGMSSFSGWGPTDDGRIKPDICGNGVNVFSTVSSGIEDYGIMSGTSMASPNVTGSLVLLQQHYHSLYDEYMLATTLKALVINTADETGPNPGPDYMFGWGLMNTARAAQAISGKGKNGQMIADTLKSADEKKVVKFTATGAEPIRVTIVWSDPKGTPSGDVLDDPDLKLVNDLDLRVRKGENSWSPWVLDPANPANAATTGDNIRDNVEQIYIAQAEAGEYEFEVSAKKITGENGQAYSLVISGVSSVNNDIAIKEILPQVGACEYSAATPITITLQNMGLKVQSDVELRYTLFDADGLKIDEGNQTVSSIASNATSDVTITVPFEKSRMEYRLVVDLNDDENKGNNHLEKKFRTVKTDLASGRESVFQGFEGDVSAEGWSVEDANKDNTTWSLYGSDFQRSGDNFLLIFPNGGKADDWIYSNCLQLSKDDTYQLKFYHRIFKEEEKMEVFIGSSNDATGMTTKLADITLTGNWTEKVIDITVAEDGIYFIGWHATTPSSYAMGLDDIRIQNKEIFQPEAAFAVSKQTVKVGETVDFTDMSLGSPSTWEWTLEGIDPEVVATQDATGFYKKSGSYDVSLKVKNNLGEDVIKKEDFITVEKQQISMKNDAVEVYDAYFTDSQGSLDYLNGEDYVLTLTPAEEGKALQVKFLEFQLTGSEGTANDWLKVYDGKDTNAIFIQEYRGSNLPGELISKNQDGALTFVFHSDDADVAQGWKAEVGLTDPVLGANFKMDKEKLMAGQSVDFTDFSSGIPTAWEWTFEGGNPSSSTQKNPAGIQYESVGKYAVTLKVSDANGSDTRTVEGFVTVEELTFEPVAGFTAALNADKNSVIMSWVPAGTPDRLEEGFEGTWPPANWQVQHGTQKDGSDLADPTGTKTWFQCSADNFSGKGASFIHSGDYSAAIGYDSKDFNWLISPNILIQENAQLRFWTWYYNGEDGDSGDFYYTNFHVMIFHNNTWEILKTYKEGDDSNTMKSEIALDLSAYAGELVRVAFVYEYNDGYQLAIDDVVVDVATEEENAVQATKTLMVFPDIHRELSENGNNGVKSTTAKSEEMKVVGYKIYRNNQVIKQIDDAQVLTFTDTPETEGRYVYGMTAIYANPEGESAMSKEYTFDIIPLGIEDIDQAFGLKLYPNPTKDKFYIEMDVTMERVEIYNCYGAKVLAQPVARGENRLEFDLAGLATGIYIVKIYSGDQVLIRKVVVK